MSDRPWVSRALRGWFGFWFGPGGRSATVWLVWLGLTAATFAFIRRFGQNIPSWEEWVFLPGLLGERSRWGWVCERLMEHRYPLGRAVFLGLFELGGRDFRVPMYASGAVLAAAAAVLLRAAAAVRGRNDYPDILLPVLVLNAGGYENLILAYQIQFALDVLLAAVLVRSATSPSPSGWRLVADGGLLALLALGGWIGLAFVPGGLAWVAWRAWARCRRHGVDGRAVAAVAAPLAAAGYFVWCYLDVRRNPEPGALANGPADAARVAAEFLASVFGTAAPAGWPWTAAAGVGVFAFVVLALGRDWVTRPDRRVTAGGWLVAVSAVALMGYGVAQGRPNGYAVRNLPVVGLVAALAHLIAARGTAGRPAARVAWAAVAVPLAVFVYWHGWQTGGDFAGPHWDRNDRFERDRAAGLPLDYLACRHQLYPFPQFRDSVRLLRDTGHPAAAGIPDPPAVRPEPLAVPPPTREPVPNDPFQASVRGRPRVWQFDRGAERAITGVRVRFDYRGQAVNVPMHVLWVRPDGGVAAAECRPWLTPYTWEMDFWVNDRAGAIWFRALDEGQDRIELREVQLLLPGG